LSDGGGNHRSNHGYSGGIPAGCFPVFTTLQHGGLDYLERFKNELARLINRCLSTLILAGKASVFEFQN
jgi:hypothetical protein